MALNLAPFSRWTLRDKAAQRRLALLNSSNNIIYNKSKITLDITEAVLNSTIVTK